MLENHAVLTQLSNDALIAEVKRLATDERKATAALIAALAEIDVRQLYRAEGCSSLFVYCTSVLRLSEHAAYRRIEAARAARRFPAILERLRAGAINLTTIGLIAPLMTEDNQRTWLDAASDKSRREVEKRVAMYRPKPDVPSVVRKLPVPRVPQSERAEAAETAAPERATKDEMAADEPTAVTFSLSTQCPASNGLRAAWRSTTTPLSEQRYKLVLTVSAETHSKLEKVQNLMRHAVPNGDLAAIFDRALTVLLAKLEKAQPAQVDRPRVVKQPGDAVNSPIGSPGQVSRHIPAHVRRMVWKGAGGQCTFVGHEGRCRERGFLQFHHLTPFAAGGRTTPENLTLRCAAHNRYDAEVFFSKGAPAEARVGSPQLGSEPS